MSAQAEDTIPFLHKYARSILRASPCFRRNFFSSGTTCYPTV